MAQEGRLDYTERAFIQDSAQAMLGKIDRALVELVTNADDAYGDKAGPILVDITEGSGEYKLQVSVRDFATGLLFDEMKAAFTKIGAKKSKLAAGGQSRGLLGRGAKDVAVFGKVHFASYKAAKISDLTISSDSSWVSEYQDEPDTDELLAKFGFDRKASGMLVTIHVKSLEQFPKPADLRNKLSNTAQLRDLIERRSIELGDFRKPTANGRLHSTLPLGNVIFDQSIELVGTGGKSAHLVVKRFTERQPGQVSPFSANGILIKSGLTIFENTWFELSSRTESALLGGVLEVPWLTEILVDELTKDVQPVVSVLTRTRDGINKAHQAYDVIARAVRLAAIPLMDQINSENTQSNNQGEALSRDFQVAGQAIKDDLAAMLRDLDEEQIGGNGDGSIPPFTAVPATIVVEPGQPYSISLRAANDLIVQDLKIAVRSGLVDENEINQDTGKWLDHPRLDGFSKKVWRGQSQEIGISEIAFTLGQSTSLVQVVCRLRLLPEPEPPTCVEFTKVQVTSAPGRGKNLLLAAPIDYVNESVLLMFDGFENPEQSESVTFTQSETGAWAQAHIFARAPLQSGVFGVTATSPDGSSASCSLVVKEIGADNQVQFEFLLDGDPEPFERYALTRTETLVQCKIYGRHRAFGGVFGSFQDGKFANEDSPAARAVMAQVICQSLADNLVEIASTKRPEDYVVASDVLFKHREFVNKLVGKVHRALAG